MIQYNNFLMKREQSRAGSRFAECEKSRLKAKILITLALLLTAVTGARAAWTGGTYTATANENLGAITVNGDATLTINSDVTVTVTGGINVASGTLTVTGPGTLVVTGSTGSNGTGVGSVDTEGGTGGTGGVAISGNIIVQGGATVTATGGNGGNGGNGENYGGKGGTGGVAISGNIIVQGGATVTATGGTGGTGATGGWYGGNGGNGGNAFAGTLTYKSGTVTANGGSGGSGAQSSDWDPYKPSSGSAGKAFANDVDFTQTTGYSVTNGTDPIGSVLNQTKVVISGGTDPITVEPVEGKTNEWTFSMPGSDVVLTPQYALAAQLDENGAPAAVSGLEIAADAAIITAGQSAQGTLLYAVSTSATEQPALTDFSATLPNAKDQTAAGNYYVWYYIQGHDTPQGQEPSAENTFNDSEIMGPVTVELLTNEHTLNIKQSPNITVTVAGSAKTPTDDKVTPVTTGQEVKIKANEGYKFRKVEVKKKEAPKYADVVKICDKNADNQYLVSSFFDGTNANFTTITKEEAMALAEYLGGGDIRVVYEEYESYGTRYARATKAAGNTSGLILSTATTTPYPLYYVPAGN